jgi:hypothetical protein
MTKEEAHYGEVHFCSFCKHIRFRYGDYYCLQLDAPVAESGYCDVYEKDGKPTPDKPTVTVKTCADCIYNMGGMCGKTGELIKKKACSLYSTEAQDIYVGIDEAKDVGMSTEVAYVYECVTCADAYYDEEGIAMCRRFNSQLDMSDLTACVEYNEDLEVSNDEVCEGID